MCKGDFKDTVCGASEGLFSALMMSGIGYLSSNPMFCFVAGTAVLTIQGKKAIETIRVGDVIPCVDHITGEKAEKRVVSTSVNKVDRLIELNIDGEILKCTETHPFQVKGRGWVNASELAPGDILYTKDWDTATVKSVNLLELDEPVEVYNFEVEDCHTYFVGDRAVIVHNNCQIHGKAHGKTVHLNAINAKRDLLASSGNYTDIWLNMQLNSAGLVGRQRPDIIAKTCNGTYEYYEYASASQASGKAFCDLKEKMGIINNANNLSGVLYEWGKY